MAVSFRSVRAPKVCLSALIALGTRQRFLTSEKLRPKQGQRLCSRCGVKRVDS
jgi:hypothetical protein